MRTIAAVLLLTSLYTDAQLFADKRMMVRPNCVRTGPCDMWELGWLDEQGQFHPRQRMSTEQMRQFMNDGIKSGAIKNLETAR
jgi:hypothetical protein